MVLAGGGTGGHIFAGVTIAQEFLGQSRANRVLFIGSSIGLESRLVPKAGLPLFTLPVGKLVGQTHVQKIRTILQIPFAVFRCALELRRFKADMVIGVGGYSSGPCILAARILRIPVGVLEQNSVVGLTNRAAALMAEHVFLAFEKPPAGISPRKCIFTGNPTRANLRPSPAKSAQPFQIFAFGGSQGAAGINRMMLEAVEDLKDLWPNLRIVHQTGDREFKTVCDRYRSIGFSAQVHAFIEDMQSQYDQATVVVCRAGSSTISELAATRNAAIFVPFPFAAGNHQEVNARVLEREGAARVLPQLQGKENTPGQKLAEILRDLITNPLKTEKMRVQMGSFYKPDAARQIVDIMKAHAYKLGT